MMTDNYNNTLLRLTLFFVSFVLLSGCGFKPRGSGYESVIGQKIFLSSENKYNQFERELKEKLIAYSMEVTSAVEDDESILTQSGIRILSVDSSKRTISVDSDGRPTEFETKISVKLNFYFHNNEKLENKNFYSERDYRFDKNSSLAYDKELETLKSEMYEELGHRISTQFLRRLAND